MCRAKLSLSVRQHTFSVLGQRIRMVLLKS